MNLAKRYTISDGTQCNILQLVKSEPEWVASIIQRYEDCFPVHTDGQEAHRRAKNAMKLCPKCGRMMTRGAPHADGDEYQWECECGYTERPSHE